MLTPNALPEPAVARFAASLDRLWRGGPARLGIAVSGGPDSLALLLLAHAALPGRIAAATVDHGLRVEAADEAAAVRCICAALSIPHRILTPHPPIKPGGNVQERARMARYKLLGRWALEENLGDIAVAHHADDVAETFLMRALRSSGVGGLARMQDVSPLPYGRGGGVTLLRPLLDWRRSELAEIVAAAGVTAFNDPSNTDQHYDRAKIRALLNGASAIDPAALARCAANLRDAEDALEWMTDQAWRSRAATEDDHIRIDAANLPREIRRRLASRAIIALAPAWNGEGLDMIVEALDHDGSATVAGIKASAGPVWHFCPAPPRRAPR